MILFGGRFCLYGYILVIKCRLSYMACCLCKKIDRKKSYYIFIIRYMCSVLLSFWYLGIIEEEDGFNYCKLFIIKI